MPEGEGEKPDNANGGGKKPGEGDPPKEDPKPAPAPKLVEFTAEQQAVIDKTIKERLERQKAQLEEKSKSEAAKKAGEYQKLYEELEPKHRELVAEHEELKAQVQSLRQVVEGLIEAERKQLPESVQKLDPKHSDPVKELEWLTTAKAETPNLKKPAAPGNEGNPKPVGPEGQKTEEQIKQERVDAGRKTGRYGRM